MADDFISNLQSLTSNLEEIVFTRFATVIKKNDDHTVDCREDSGTVHKNIKHSNLFNFQVGDTVILGFVDNDLYEPIIVGTRDVDLGVPTSEEIDELVTDLNTLTTDITNLKNSLIRFNGELISFSADNHNLAENLSKLKENLKFVLDDVKILDAGLGEFYDVLESFGIDIDEFVETLMGLNIDLNILQGYLSDFSGTLEQFDAKLRNELDEETYNKLNEDMVKLIWSISQVRGRTTTVEGQARHLADEIGDDTGYDPSTTQPSNLKQWIKWIKWKVGDSNSGMIKDIEALEALIGDDTPGAETGIFADLVTANNHITTINNYIYGNGDAQHPASGSILYQINTLVNTDIPKILTDIYGKPDGTSSDYTANSLYGKLVYMENQLWGNGSSGSPSSDSILGRLGAISNNAGTGRLDLLDKQGGTLDTLDSRINGITNTGGTGRLDNIDKTGGTLDSLDSRIGAITNNSNNGRLDLIDKNGGLLDGIGTRIDGITNSSGTGTLDELEDELGTNDSTKPAYTDNTTLWWKIRDIISKVGSNTSGSESGIYLLIANLTSAIGSSSDSVSGTSVWAKVNKTIDKLYGFGTNPSTQQEYDETHPKTGTVWDKINGLLTGVANAETEMYGGSQYDESTALPTSIWGRIKNLRTSVGTVNVDLKGDLANQTTNHNDALNSLLNGSFIQWTPVWIVGDSSGDWVQGEYAWVLDNKYISTGYNLEYWKYSSTTNGEFRRVYRYDATTKSSNVMTDAMYQNYVNVKCVGVCYELTNKTVVSSSDIRTNEPYNIIYEFKTNTFYKKNNGTWTPTTDIDDYFDSTALYKLIDDNFATDAALASHTHSTWTTVQFTTGSGTLYVNEALRLCEMYFNGTGLSLTTSYSSIGKFPSTYTPAADRIWCETSYDTTHAYIDNTAVNNYTHVYANTTGSNTAIQCHAMWHY